MDDLSADELRRAVAVLRGGGVVAHASEGVWGLACDPFDRDAVDRVLRIKGREAAKGLIVIGADDHAFRDELEALEADAQARIRASWPGAVTWVVPSKRFPEWITGGRATVAIRVPDHGQARALARAFGGRHRVHVRESQRRGAGPHGRCGGRGLGRRGRLHPAGRDRLAGRAQPNRRRDIRRDPAMTDRYAVIGNPVSHSLSPRIHAAFAEDTGEDVVYGSIEAPSDGFAAAASCVLRERTARGSTSPCLSSWMPGRGSTATTPPLRPAVP